MAAITRTSTGCSCRPPSRRNVRSCSTRSSLTCVAGTISAISSRNSVPRCASSKHAGAAIVRAGERALLVAEDLALEQRLGNRRAVDRRRTGTSRAGSARGSSARRAPCPCPTRPRSAPTPRRRRLLDDAVDGRMPGLLPMIRPKLPCSRSCRRRCRTSRSVSCRSTAFCSRICSRCGSTGLLR